MKLFASVLLLSATLALGYPSVPASLESEGWLVPQLDGSVLWMDEESAQMEVRDLLPSTRAATVIFYLYTKENPTNPQVINPSDTLSLTKSNYNAKNPTRIIIHGWNNNYLSDVNINIRTALMAKGPHNIICVDWGKNAQTINYPMASMHVKSVGKQVATLADFLHQRGSMLFASLHIIGHSLGAHCAGFAGKNVKRGRVHTIVGLDPALPLYSYDKPAERLASTDAIYVESIHTCAGLLGFLEPIGKAAFYPNGGKSQPGCGIDASGACAHARAHQYYAESIERNNFPSMRCNSYENAVGKNCGTTYSAAKLGAPANDGTASGSYFTPVNKNSPFGQG